MNPDTVTLETVVNVTMTATCETCGVEFDAPVAFFYAGHHPNCDATESPHTHFLMSILLCPKCRGE